MVKHIYSGNPTLKPMIEYSDVSAALAGLGLIPEWISTLENAGIKSEVNMENLIELYLQTMKRYIEEKKSQAERAEKFTVRDCDKYKELLQHIDVLDEVTDWIHSTRLRDHHLFPMETRKLNESIPGIFEKDKEILDSVANELGEIGNQLEKDIHQYQKYLEQKRGADAQEIIGGYYFEWDEAQYEQLFQESHRIERMKRLQFLLQQAPESVMNVSVPDTEYEKDIRSFYQINTEGGAEFEERSVFL